MAIDLSQRIERGIRDFIINLGIGQKYMALNKVPELQNAVEALEKSKNLYMKDATPEQKKLYGKLEGQVEEQMSTTGLAHAGTLLNNIKKMQAILHNVSGQHPNPQDNVKENLDTPVQEATRLLTKALATTPEERKGAFASYSKERLDGKSEVTMTLEQHIDQKKKPHQDISFHSQHGHDASIMHHKDGQVSVKVRSTLHPQEAAIDMANLLASQGFKKGEFNEDGSFKKDKNGNDMRGDSVTIDGLDKIDEAEKKMLDKFKNSYDSSKGPFVVLAQIICNLVEYAKFHYEKNKLEQQALACYARGYEVEGVENLSKDFREKLKESRVNYLKSEAREQENVKELGKGKETPDVQLGKGQTPNKENPEKQGVTITAAKKDEDVEKDKDKDNDIQSRPNI